MHHHQLIVILLVLLSICEALTDSCTSDESCSGKPVSFVLHNGEEIELLGFGTAGLGESTYSSMRGAIAAGFRHFDSAQADEWYREADVGAAISDAMKEDPNLQRKNFSIVTKVHPRDFRPEKLLLAFEKSLANLQTQYVDLLLLHFPSCWPDGSGPGNCPPNSGTWEDVWGVLEELYHQNKVKALGASNFDVDLLDLLWSKAKVKPHVVQNWFDPFHQDKAVRAWCDHHSVLYSGYSTFGSQWFYMGRVDQNPVFSSPVINEIAETHQVSLTETVLSWALQLGVSVLPRSSKLSHIQSNAYLFPDEQQQQQQEENSSHPTLYRTFLTEQDMMAFDNLDGTL
mmetsp:Transcript_19296/g.24884  ORF Transcript_19296/g.24884 Transcript_19296/m.24884 type:complete len:342 (-) Transcript_19296:98-1123(-)